MQQVAAVVVTSHKGEVVEVVVPRSHKEVAAVEVSQREAAVASQLVRKWRVD